MILVSLIRNENALKHLDEPEGLHVKMFPSTITEDHVGILLLGSVVYGKCLL